MTREEMQEMENLDILRSQAEAQVARLTPVVEAARALCALPRSRKAGVPGDVEATTEWLFRIAMAQQRLEHEVLKLEKEAR